MRPKKKFKQLLKKEESRSPKFKGLAAPPTRATLLGGRGYFSGQSISLLFYIVNISSRAFEDPVFFAQLIEVPVELVEGIWHIHIALSSNLRLNPDKFHHYCQHIKQIYEDSVGTWSELNTTIHKILDHAYLVLRILPRGLTSGQLSEEAPGN